MKPTMVDLSCRPAVYVEARYREKYRLTEVRTAMRRCGHLSITIMVSEKPMTTVAR